MSKPKIICEHFIEVTLVVKLEDIHNEYGFYVANESNDVLYKYLA